MSLLPSSPDVAPEAEPRVVGLDSEAADDLMAALSSTTARELLAELHEEPAPPGELADRVDTSLQNAQYHLEKLEDAGAIEVVGTAYSEKGREMRVYGPADRPLVIFAGEKERASGLRAALSRLFGGFAALVVGSLVVQQLFGERLLGGVDLASEGGGDAGTAGPTATPTPDDAFNSAGNGGGGAGGGGPGERATETASEGATGTDTPAATPSDDAASGGTATPSGGDDTPAPESTGTESGDAAAETGDAASGGGDAPTETVGEAAETVTEGAGAATPTPTGDEVDLFGIVDAAFGSGLPPGLAFFLGGATVLTLIVATTYMRTRP